MVDTQSVPGSQPPFVGRIPVRNLWLLMLYASGFYRQLGYDRIKYEDNPNDIPDLLAEILIHAVEKRLKRNLSFGYRSHAAVLPRVRGRINLLKTEQDQLLLRGLVACQFQRLSIDTPRNRLIRAALDKLRTCVKQPALVQRCRVLVASLKRLGVGSERPCRAEISAEQYGCNDCADRFMVAAALLAFDLALPTETEGDKLSPIPDRDIHWVRKLFEKAVAGFYDVVLSPLEWRVEAGKYIDWQMESKTAGIEEIFPKMQTDIILNNPDTGQRIVIDTKFNSILTQGWYRDSTLRSGYIYQIYAYLRSQEMTGDPVANNASGVLLHPSVGQMIDETVAIQGHKIRFATVDLGASSAEIRSQLLKITVL